jgi:hypothetical protein
MLPTIVLPDGGCLFEADVVRGDEVHERRRWMRADQGEDHAD